MYHLYAKKISDKRKYYFTGSSFNTLTSAAKSYPTITAGKKAIKTFLRKIKGNLPKGVKLKSIKIRAKKTFPLSKLKKAKKNPAKKTVSKKILAAIKNFEKFSGHTPEYIDKKDLPKMDVGFKIGMLDGLLYTTVRDGRTEKYVHKFKRRARPILVSNFDGSFIALVGGNYKFTDRGIEDN